MSSRLYVLQILITTVIAQYFYVPQVPMVPQVRQTYYPIRMNCVNRCGQQRYRWNYRPSGEDSNANRIAHFEIESRTADKTNLGIAQPLPPPIQPLPNIKISFGTTTPPTPPPPVPLVTPVTPFSSLNATSTEAPKPEVKPEPATRKPDLPTPAPFTNDAENTPESTMFMRPTRRPIDVIRPPMSRSKL
ncbi:hypothetical protein L596_019946 [Steinernema carpocapsae]|uniref:Uncharacterized protein n=1 Tax=Steinernema carpocapsae TaxID=34508 RepID=A0A4U5MSN9_STECR|nr:hypothetical protein L596_019946 [Steinernema carpocapsae]